MKNRPFKITSGRFTDRSTLSLTKYLADVSAIDPFVGDEEYKCAVAAYNGDEVAKKELVNRNLRFVISVAKSYVKKGVELGDLINEGNIGLTVAAEKFNPDRGFKFISYAIFYIRRNILNFLGENEQLIRIPNNQRDAINKLRQMLVEAEQRLGRQVTFMDLITDDMSNDEIEELTNLSQVAGLNISSLDKPLDLEGGTGSMHELIPDNSFGGTDKLVIDESLSDVLKTVMSQLSPLERAVIEARYGLNGGARMTLKECSSQPHINVSRERVRQIESKALRMLKGLILENASELV